MLYKLAHIIRKEFTLLLRDIGGLLIVFLMPILLLIVITLIQSSTFESISSSKLSLLLIDNDKGEIADSVIQNIKRSQAFELVTSKNGSLLNENQAKKLVFDGAYQMAIVIPKDLSKDLNLKINQNVSQILAEFDLDSVDNSIIKNKEVKIYFDPISQVSFRNVVKAEVDKLITQIERDKVYKVFQEKLGVSEQSFDTDNFIAFREMLPQNQNEDQLTPNASQHNVPAWSLFGIFFIILPLSINLVREKTLGTLTRFRTLATPYWLLMIGKMLTYAIVTLLQFYVMLLIGMYCFPFLGLPAFEVGDQLLNLSIVALFAGLAAISLGILIGTIAKTQEQCAPLGATLVVILAAIGGVWVPVFVMPPIMQKIANISPMNWALDAFYDLILRNASISSILSAILLLFLFATVTISIAITYDQKKRSI